MREKEMDNLIQRKSARDMERDMTLDPDPYFFSGSALFERLVQIGILRNIIKEKYRN